MYGPSGFPTEVDAAEAWNRRAASAHMPVPGWQPTRETIPLGWTLIHDRHFNALADAMAEIKATNDGVSIQPIAEILAWCLREIEVSKPSIQGAAAPLPQEA